jgi:hypothetical protein
MLKSSRYINLVLASLALVLLGYVSCDQDDDGYSTTQSTSPGGHSHSSYWRSYHGSSSSSGSSSHSGTSRGGFGSTGHSAS